MGNIDKFLAKPIEVTIGGDQFMLKPFTVNDLSMMTRMSSKEETIKAGAIKEAIMKVFKQIDPQATEAQLGEVSIEFLEDVMESISKVNNLDVSDAKQKLMKEMSE